MGKNSRWTQFVVVLVVLCTADAMRGDPLPQPTRHAVLDCIGSALTGVRSDLVEALGEGTQASFGDRLTEGTDRNGNRIWAYKPETARKIQQAKERLRSAQTDTRRLAGTAGGTEADRLCASTIDPVLTSISRLSDLQLSRPRFFGIDASRDTASGNVSRFYAAVRQNLDLAVRRVGEEREPGLQPAPPVIRLGEQTLEGVLKYWTGNFCCYVLEIGTERLPGGWQVRAQTLRVSDPHGYVGSRYNWHERRVRIRANVTRFVDDDSYQFYMEPLAQPEALSVYPALGPRVVTLEGRVHFKAHDRLTFSLSGGPGGERPMLLSSSALRAVYPYIDTEEPVRIRGPVGIADWPGTSRYGRAINYQRYELGVEHIEAVARHGAPGAAPATGSGPVSILDVPSGREP
jgi:hypothetical protein